MLVASEVMFIMWHGVVCQSDLWCRVASAISSQIIGMSQNTAGGQLRGPSRLLTEVCARAIVSVCSVRAASCLSVVRCGH